LFITIFNTGIDKDGVALVIWTTLSGISKCTIGIVVDEIRNRITGFTPTLKGICCFENKKKTLFDLIDTYIRDAKTRQAYL